ncbi:hypothetical protein BGZ94_009816 [Podila epigama]|nr:hypothetical protein BGZ94_009816 [Podila epigama]
MTLALSSAAVLRAPVQAALRRQYTTASSSAGNSSTVAQPVGHSTKRLVGASVVSAVLGADATCAYFYFKNK